MPDGFRLMYREDYEAMVKGTTKEEDTPYLYFSEEKDRNAALAIQGDVTRARLRHHLHRHINGKGNLTVAFIGGSITWSESLHNGSKRSFIRPHPSVKQPRKTDSMCSTVEFQLHLRLL